VEAFITGSRVYGTPTETSDLDLVVLMDRESRDTLIKEFGLPIRCGKLNIIALTDEVEMLAWKKAKEVCVAAAKSGPITRDYAVEVHKAWFHQYGVEHDDHVGSGNLPPDIAAAIEEAKQEARERRTIRFDRAGQYK
jgi:hypothetical protein